MKQTTSESSIAIQSGGDTILNSGVTPEQMAMILDALAKQLPAFVQIARDTVDQRLEEFRKKIIDSFAKPGSNPEAFKDPDFQYVLTRAQYAYARSGEPDLAETLVDMIAERSRQTERTRLTLALNSAIEKAADLTEEEFAELSIVFIMGHTRRQDVKSLDTFKRYFEECITPFLASVSKEASSYQYLESQQCASMDIGARNFHSVFKDNYAGIIQKGFGREELLAKLPSENAQLADDGKFVIKCLNDPTKLQFNAVNSEALGTVLSNAAIPENKRPDLVRLLFEEKCWTAQELNENLSKLIPSFPQFFDLWEKSPSLMHLRLTAIGIAIGYCNAKRLLTGFDADLRIWIK